MQMMFCIPEEEFTLDYMNISSTLYRCRSNSEATIIIVVAIIIIISIIIIIIIIIIIMITFIQYMKQVKNIRHTKMSYLKLQKNKYVN